jgi:hypothetical protein
MDDRKRGTSMSMKAMKEAKSNIFAKKSTVVMLSYGRNQSRRGRDSQIGIEGELLGPQHQRREPGRL